VHEVQFLQESKGCCSNDINILQQGAPWGNSGEKGAILVVLFAARSYLVFHSMQQEAAWIVCIRRRKRLLGAGLAGGCNWCDGGCDLHQ
jgi:hypothetical protein